VKNRPVKLFAVVPPGLETICRRELQPLGVRSTRSVRGGVEFVGGLRELYLANLWLRSASRVLVRVGEFRSRDFPAFFRKCRQLAWGEFIRPGQPLKIRVTSRKSRLFHTDRVEQVVREAIGHVLGEPRVDSSQVDVMLVVQVIDDHCLISVDSSGEHLHRRGYRKKAVPAPIRENLAAGLLLHAGWSGNLPLLDPMCGSGSFVIEAALLAANLPPGSNRHFAFMDWPGYRAGLWQTLLAEAGRQQTQLKIRIEGRDLSEEALDAAQQNAAAAGVAEWIDWQVGDVLQLPPPEHPGLVICNPPYGGRLGDATELPGWYRRLGLLFEQYYPEWKLALIVPDPGLLSGWQRDLRNRLSCKNGGIEVCFVCSDQEKA